MATYTDQLVVYSAGSLKKMEASETIEIHGITVPDGGLTLGSTAVSSTAAELNILDGVTATNTEINVLDGATSANNTTGKAAILGTNGNLTIAGDLTVSGTTTTVSSTTLTVDDKNLELGSVDTPSDTTADGGGITLKGATDKTFSWVNSTDSWTSSEHLDLASGKSLNIAGTSVLNATTLGSGVVSSSLTSVGTLSTLTVDNVIINGTTIGHTSDNDLITLASGVVTVAGEISVATLDIGGTNVTSTASELNILDGVTATAAELNILDGVTATAAELNILDGVTATASELNILDGVTSTTAELNIIDGNTSASSITVVDADRVVMNDDGTMKQVAASTLKSYFQTNVTASAIAADDVSAGDATVTIETSSGSVNVKDFGQGSTQLQILSTNSSDSFEAGHVVSLEEGATGGLKLADKDDSTVVVGIAIEASSTNSRGHGEGGTPAAANIDVVTLWGSKVNVKIPSGTPGLGVPVYLGDSGVALVGSNVPTSGTVYRLGFTVEDASGGSAVTDVDIIWMPQFIADLG